MVANHAPSRHRDDRGLVATRYDFPIPGNLKVQANPAKPIERGIQERIGTSPVAIDHGSAGSCARCADKNS